MIYDIDIVWNQQQLSFCLDKVPTKSRILAVILAKYELVNANLLQSIVQNLTTPLMLGHTSYSSLGPSKCAYITCHIPKHVESY